MAEATEGRRGPCCASNGQRGRNGRLNNVELSLPVIVLTLVLALACYCFDVGFGFWPFQLSFRIVLRCTRRSQNWRPRRKAYFFA
jgi:hypothetical protein